MNLEDSIKGVISKKLEDGTIENLVQEQLEKGVLNALDSLFRSYGDVTKVIENQIKSVMIPYLEKYDYSQYITKLDSVLVDVLKNSALENKKLLENFKEVMTVEEDRDKIKLSEIFNVWKLYVSKNVSTDDLEINYDDDPTYQDVTVTLDVDYDNSRSWSSMKSAIVNFECEQDEEMNFAFKIYKWTDNTTLGSDWRLDYKENYTISSLKNLTEFEVFLMKLQQNNVKIDLDTDDERDHVEVVEEPEASFS